MRDNARRLLTILTVILALWLVLGFWPLSIGNQVIFSLCILLAGGAALWRQRRRAVSRQRSEIVLPPEDFQGAVVLVCGDTDGLFPGRSAHGETRHGWYLRGDSAEQLPRLAQYLAAARPALVSQVSVLLAVVPEHHPSGASGAVAARLAAEYRSVPNLAKRSAAGVERVLGDAARRPGRGKPLVYHHAGEGWSPGAAEGQAPQAVAGWQREGSSASRLHQTLWLESILTLAENALFRPFRARQAELPPLNLCAAGICLTPVAAVANNLWQQQIAGITTLSRATTRRQVLTRCRIFFCRHCRTATGSAAGCAMPVLPLGWASSFWRWRCWLPLSTTSAWCAASAIIWRCITASAARRRRRSCRRSSVCVPTAACWMTGCAGEPLRYRLGLYQGAADPLRGSRYQ